VTASILWKAKLKGRLASFVFLEKPLHEVCLIRKREEIDKNNSTVGNHWVSFHALNLSFPDVTYLVQMNHQAWPA